MRRRQPWNGDIASYCRVRLHPDTLSGPGVFPHATLFAAQRSSSLSYQIHRPIFLLTVAAGKSNRRRKMGRIIMPASAVLLMLIPVAGGWAVSFAGSASLRSPALHRGFAAGGATQGSRASVLRGKNARWVAQMNPVEKLASELGDVMAGVTGSTSKSFHEERMRYHEERMRYHEERMRFHRRELASKKTARVDTRGGGMEERMRLEAVSSGRPMQILFVDLANTCRSPAAEALMRSLVDGAALGEQIIVRSAGTGAGTRDWFKEGVSDKIERERADPRMVSHGSKRGLNLAGRQSVMLTKSELRSADLVIVMDGKNQVEVETAAAHWRVGLGSKVRLLTEYCRSGTMTTDIPDPYYGGGSGGAGQGQVFEKVLDLLEDGCRGLLRDCAPDAV